MKIQQSRDINAQNTQFEQNNIDYLRFYTCLYFIPVLYLFILFKTHIDFGALSPSQLDTSKRGEFSKTFRYRFCIR